MKRALLWGFIAILLVALVICGFLSAAIFGIRQTEAKQEELSRIARITAGQFDPAQNHNAQAQAFAAQLSGIRVTIINANGQVTGDSAADYAMMENHADRPEILEARGAKAAVSIRHSGTLGQKLMYAVIKTPAGYYIRLAEQYGGLAAALFSFLPALSLAALLSLTVAAALAHRFSRSVTGPLLTLNHSLSGVKDGSVTLIPEHYPYEELRDMAVKINALAADISLHIGRLEEEKEKIAFILDNMKEGFILLDDKQTLLLINNSACTYLDCGKDLRGQSVLHCTRNFDLLQAVNKALASRENQAIDLLLGGRIIDTQLTIASQQPGISGGLIITMTDVTERRSAVKTRRDFFANASHELKTPITSIKGSVELLCADIPLEESQRQELLTRIGLETERMYSLINDIIMINRIESGEVAEDKEQLDLSAIICECCNELMPLAEQNNIAIQVKSESAVLSANRKKLNEMASNLIMNALKYNRPGGSIDINLKCSGDNVFLTVHNDGEPIPPEHQQRIFERFYRVDKGRSKAVGGTGLGLAIVKHVVDSLGGTIKLESTEERGTTFTVKIPR